MKFLNQFVSFIFSSLLITPVLADTVSVDVPNQTAASVQSTPTAPAGNQQSQTPTSSQAQAPANTQSTAAKQPTAKPAATEKKSTAKKPVKNAASSDTDTSITNSIKAAIETNKEVANTKVSVSTKNGVVTLIGEVDTNKQGDIILEIAQSITGVKSVDLSKFTLKNKKGLAPNTGITAEINGVFIREKITGDKRIIKPIEVSTENGIVTLKGSVTDQKLIDQMIKLVGAVPGIFQVNSEISVEKTNTK